MNTSFLLAVLFCVALVNATRVPTYYFLSSNSCEGIKDSSSCVSSTSCEWCTSGAVGDSCMSTEDASALPSSVFTCSGPKVAAVQATTCENIKDESACMSSSEGSTTCSWCTSGAVGASCMLSSDASALPSSVFQCEFQEAKGMRAGLTVANPSLRSGSGTIGIDISQALSSSTASCFVSNGAGAFLLPRGYRSSGSTDPNMCASLKAAQSAGIAKRGTYMFPCPTCSASASSQVSQLVSSIKSCGAPFNEKIWLDIEGSQYWTGSTSSNQAWYKSLVDACKSSGYSCGVYSSSSQWSAIFGSTSFSYGASLPLWYAHYDNVASFSDFKAFGGWTTPHAKQYAGDVTLCSFGVDKNYSPNL